jgi:preprotein translocase subunit SecE
MVRLGQKQKKIAWPLRKETIASTTVVVVIVLIVSFYLGVVDAILSRAVKLILS